MTAVPPQFAATTMRKYMGLRFKRVKKVPFAGNLPINLCKRHLFTKVLLGLLRDGKRILNIDETWLNEVSKLAVVAIAADL